MFQRISCAALLALTAPIACLAQPAGLKASGVEVLEGGWKSPNHVGASFTALMAAQDGKVGKFDYYYQVRVVNEMKPTFANVGPSIPLPYWRSCSAPRICARCW